jgi:hypothetical protein
MLITRKRRKAMRNKGGMMPCGWMVVIAVVSLSLLWSLTVPSKAKAQAPGAVCVLQLIADNEVLGILVDTPENFNIAVALPLNKKVNMPVPCDRLDSLALAVSNQKNNNVNVAAQVFTHNGGLICSKGPFLIPVNGGTGITFADCQ